MSEKIYVGPELPYETRAIVTGAHLIAAAIFASVAIMVVLFLGYSANNFWVVWLAVLSSGVAYLSQLFGANAVWSQSDGYFRVQWVCLALAIFLWVVAAVSLLGGVNMLAEVANP